MAKIELIAEGINVSRIYWMLQQHPELWNMHTERTESPDSPHYGLDDIWVRYGKPEHAVNNQAHAAQWYPCADMLGVKQLCLDLMRHVGGVELGGVLITRIKPGKICRPHEDHGWHARYYDKFLVQISSAPGQAFHFEDERLETKPGDVAWFDNKYTHWVTNDTPYERVSMIVCIRVEK
jgi:hypothetical protein